MSKISDLYVAKLEDSQEKWGLFYEENGTTKALTENFKPVVFGSKVEARSKLDSIESERRREDVAEPFSLDDARAFTESHKWKYATTYAQTAPHEYLVKRWLDEEDRHLFERLVQTINKEAVTGYFYEHENRYLILGDQYYWYMPCYPDNMAVDLINRTTTDYLEYRNGAYHYKPKKIGEENKVESDRLQRET